MHKPHRFILLLLPAVAFAQTPVTIRVNASEIVAPFKPIYGLLGYDEPNYTYTPNGRKLIGELAALSPRFTVYIRTHFLLATGDGTPGLKWGSTNAYTEDASGKPVYDWTIPDRIFDTYLPAGRQPFVEVGFMPEALSTEPEPYAGIWIPERRTRHYSAAGPIRRRTMPSGASWCTGGLAHAVEKYGADEVAAWYWEIWNEPDIGYLARHAGRIRQAVRLLRARSLSAPCRDARVGGPATTGGGSNFPPRVSGALRSAGRPAGFRHLSRQRPPAVVEGACRMGIANHACNVLAGSR